MKPPAVTLSFFLFFILSCEQGSKSNEDEKGAAEGKDQYDRTEQAEGNLWGEADLNNFLQEAAAMDQMQIRAGDIAEKQATHEAITGFAQGLKTDHSNSLNKLRKIAREENLNLVDSIDADHQKKLEELETNDTNFNTLFLEMMVQAHKKDLGKVRNAMKNIADDHPLKIWANEALTMMQQHLYRAERLLQDSSVIPEAENDE